MIVCIRRYFTNHETYHNTQLDLDKLHVDVYTCMYSAYSFSLAHAKKKSNGFINLYEIVKPYNLYYGRKDKT